MSALSIISWLAVASGIICAAFILGDMFIGGHRQKMPIMAWVWPITALYSGPLGLYFYYRYGREQTTKKPFWATTAVGVSHCGGGCTLGDIIGGFFILFIGWQIAGQTLWPEYIVDFSLAFLLGIVFQYFSIAPMRGLGFKDGIIAALKVDALSLIAFEIGLFGWMALVQLVFFPAHIHADEVTYWFMMQVGMLIGFATAYPVNWWLIKKGIKEAM